MDLQQKPATFAAEYEPAESLGRRRSPRAPGSLDARIGRGGLDRALCKVTDISMHGAGLQTYSDLRLGTMIWLALPKIGHVAANVVWVGDFEAGLEFQTPLTAEQFETLTAR